MKPGAGGSWKRTRRWEKKSFCRRKKVSENFDKMPTLMDSIEDKVALPLNFSSFTLRQNKLECL